MAFRDFPFPDDTPLFPDRRESCLLLRVSSSFALRLVYTRRQRGLAGEADHERNETGRYTDP
jgi:hypothetical protein